MNRLQVLLMMVCVNFLNTSMQAVSLPVTALMVHDRQCMQDTGNHNIVYVPLHMIKLLQKQGANIFGHCHAQETIHGIIASLVVDNLDEDERHLLNAYVAALRNGKAHMMVDEATNIVTCPLLEQYYFKSLAACISAQEYTDADAKTRALPNGQFNYLTVEKDASIAGKLTVQGIISGTVNLNTVNRAVQVGNATKGIKSIPVGTNGQVLLGATGADPKFASLTSTGGTITFTPGPNSLNVEAVGGGGGAAIFHTDSGTATQSGSAITVAGGANVDTAGSGSTVTVNLSANPSISGVLTVPAGSVASPSIKFAGSSNTGFSAPSVNKISMSTNGIERLNADGSGNISIDSFTTPGVVHNNASGLLTTSLIANADVAAAAGIVDTKLATISTAGKIANSATTATSTNTGSAIVARDGSGNFSAGTITASLTGAASANVLKAGDTMTGTLNLTPASGNALTATGVSGSAAVVVTPQATSKGITIGTTTGNALEVNTNKFIVVGSSGNTTVAGTLGVTGATTLSDLSSTGIVHNNASGLLSTSLIVNADIDPSAAIVDTKLATISTVGKVANSATTATSALGANTIVARDGSNNFSAGTITANLTGSASNNVLKAGDTMTGALVLPSGTLVSPALQFGGASTGLYTASSNVLSLSTNNSERMTVDALGGITITGLNSSGVVHTNGSGLLSTSSVVNSDIADGTIANTKLATVSSSNNANYIVARDGSGNFATTMVTLSGSVTNPTDAVTKSYVDSAISLGLEVKDPALAASDTNVTISGTQTIDGVALVANDRVLLINQTDAKENGLWLVQVGAWTRPTDFANGTQAGQAYVLVTSGTTYDGASWLCSTPTAVIGTDNLFFAQFSIPSQTTAANVGTGAGQVFKNKTGVTLNLRNLAAGVSDHIVVTNDTNDITLTTDATSANTASTIVARDGSGNFTASTITANLTGSASNNVLKAGDTMTGTLIVPAGSTASPSLKFSGSTNTGLSAATVDTLSMSTNGSERMNINNTGAVTIANLSSTGVVHNNASGLLSTSLIVNADVDSAAAIVDTKLATISTAGKVSNSATTATSANTASAIVARDGSNNFSAGTITANLTGQASANVLKAGDTMTGTLNLTPSSGSALTATGVSGSAALAVTPESTSKGITVGSTSGNALEVNGNKFTVVGTTGDTSVGGTLGVTGATTLSGLTSNGVVLGTSPLTSTMAGSNGQVLIGANGAAPAFATLTSTGGTITFSTGANSLNLEASGGGGGASSFPTDAGTATQSGGSLSVVGGSNINTAGSGSTVTVNLNNSPSVSGSLTAGTTLTATSGNITATNGSMIVGSTAANSTAQNVDFKKSRSGGVITSGDTLGTVSFQGLDNASTYIVGSQIKSVNSGTVGTNRIASDLQFFTHPDSTTASTQRMTISPNGNVTINAPVSGTGLTVTAGGLTVSAGGAAITGTTTINNSGSATTTIGNNTSTSTTINGSAITVASATSGTVTINGDLSINTSGGKTTTIGGSGGSVSICTTPSQSCTIGNSSNTLNLSGFAVNLNGPVSASSTITALGNISVLSTTSGTSGQEVDLKKSRSGGIIAAGDTLGTIAFQGHDGNTYTTASQITSVATGTIGSGQVGSDLQFFTHPVSTTASTQRMTIGSTGTVTINTPDSGSALVVAGGSSTLSGQQINSTGIVCSGLSVSGFSGLLGTTNINTSGTATTTIGTGGSVVIGNGAGSVTIGSGSGTVTIGNTTGNTAVTGRLTASTGLTATTGGAAITGSTTVNTSGSSSTTLGNASSTTAITGPTNINTSGTATTTIGTGGSVVIGNGAGSVTMGSGSGTVTIGNTTGNTAVTGRLTASTGLTATTGGAAITGSTTVNTSGSSSTTLGNASSTTTITGPVNINTTGTATTTIGTGGSVVVGNGAGSVTMGSGSGTVTIGNTTGNTAVTGSLTASTTLTATSGNITATAGNVVVSAGNLTLPNTNAAETQGEITLGTNRFISNYGTGNTFIGQTSGNTSLTTGSAINNTGIGLNALNGVTTGDTNIAIGASAGSSITSGVKNICIGHVGAAESNTIRIGTSGDQTVCFIQGISGATVTGTSVLCDTNGQLGTIASSARYKENIVPLAREISNALYQLQPVTFNYKADASKTEQCGLIAESVQEVLPRLVVHDKEGNPESVKYHELPVLLLQELKKQNETIQQLLARIALLEGKRQR